MWSDLPVTADPARPAQPPLAVIDDPEQAAALVQPDRQKLLEALAEPDSSAGLARRFALPRQRLNYHLRELERVGLVELVGERRKGNCIERVVRATARSYVISPTALGVVGSRPGGPTPGDRLSATYLIGVTARTIREVGSLLSRAAAAGKRVATFTLDAEIRFRTADERAQFADEFSAAVATLVARYHDPDTRGGRTFRVVTSVHPRVPDTDTPVSRRNA